MSFKRIRFSSHLDFIALLVVLAATDFMPPFVRILGSRVWTYLGITQGEWSIIIGLRGLVFIVFILAAGVLGDLRGRKKALIYLTAGFLCCFPVMIAFPPRSLPFYSAYVLSAIFSVMLRALAAAFIVLKYKNTQRIIALVIFSIVTGLGYLLSPLLAQLQMQIFEFRTVFFLPLLLALLGLYLVNRYIQESQASYDLWKPDAIALAVWTLGLCLVIFSGVLLGGLKWTDPLVLGCFTAGAILLTGTAWLSHRSASGGWRFRLNYDKRLWIAIYAGMVLYLSLYAIIVQVFNFMRNVQNINPVLSGIGLAPALVGALISLQAVRLIKRWELKSVLAGGFAVLSLPAFILSILQPNVPYLVLLISLLLLGFAFILANSPRLLLLHASVTDDLAATVQSIGSATAHLGSALAYSFMMTLIEGFGTRAYAQTLAEFGLDERQVAMRLSNLAYASEELSILASKPEQLEALQRVDYLIRQAYSTGLSYAMLVLAAVCLLSAAVIYISLRRNKQTM